ncbi:hypothetical protein F5877DRAFT_64854 [Lentinula edodes]|nr:hypothetical protein F5877DRAFT_64854 [Lentinula edodes]
MLLPPIATLVEDHPTPDSPESMNLDTQQMDEDIRPPLEGPTLGNSLGTLTTLFEFYHYERRWIHQQRNSLQDDPGLDPVSRVQESSSTDEKSSFSLSLSSGESSKLKSRASSTLRFSRWPWSDRIRGPFEPESGTGANPHRGLSDPRLILPPAGRRTGSSADDTGYSLAVSQTESSPDIVILDLFENMMEARLESCQRIDKLVRRAHGRKTDIDRGGFTRSIGDRRMIRIQMDAAAGLKCPVQTPANQGYNQLAANQISQVNTSSIGAQFGVKYMYWFVYFCPSAGIN